MNPLSVCINGAGLCKPSANNHSLCEFKIAIAVLCLEGGDVQPFILVQLLHFALPPTVHKTPLLCQHLLLFVYLLMMVILVGDSSYPNQNLKVVLICIFLIDERCWTLFKVITSCLYFLPWELCLLPKPFSKLGCLFSWCLGFLSSLYIPDMTPLSHILLRKVLFSPFCELSITPFVFLLYCIKPF